MDQPVSETDYLGPGDFGMMFSEIFRYTVRCFAYASLRASAKLRTRSSSSSLRLFPWTRASASREWSSMCRKLTAFLSRDILGLGLGDHFIAKVAAKKMESVQIDFASKYFRQFGFHRKKSQTRYMLRFKLHEHVDITLRSNHRGERNRKPPVFGYDVSGKTQRYYLGVRRCEP